VETRQSGGNYAADIKNNVTLEISSGTFCHLNQGTPLVLVNVSYDRLKDMTQ